MSHVVLQEVSNYKTSPTFPVVHQLLVLETLLLLPLPLLLLKVIAVLQLEEKNTTVMINAIITVGNLFHNYNTMMPVHVSDAMVQQAQFIRHMLGHSFGLFCSLREKKKKHFTPFLIFFLYFINRFDHI